MKNSKIALEAKLQSAIEELRALRACPEQQYDTFTSAAQLKLFESKLLNALKKVVEQLPLTTSEVALGISRVVVDQWPFDISAGDAVIQAEKALLKYQREQ